MKKAEGHSVKLNDKMISPAQMKLVTDILEYYRGAEGSDEETTKRFTDGLVRRTELKKAHGALRGKLASPYFIAKNAAVQVKGKTGLYDLTRFKLNPKLVKDESAAAAEAEAPAVKTPKKKKEAAKGKKEQAKAKKGGSQKQIEAGAALPDATPAQ